MLDANVARLTMEALSRNGGILRLAPTWVPRSFMQPGRRLKLHPADYYAPGTERGGINERWFSSVTPADNGPGTPEDEGLSYVDVDGRRFLFRDAVGLCGDDLLGADVMAKHGGWGMLCKFFDNLGPIPHHLHQMERHARLVGAAPKPEAYYFPPQLNVIANRFPYTFMGLNPGTTKEQVADCLRCWTVRDNRIVSLSRAYLLEPGTGWDIPPGILHAPGSLVTYEPQRASDVFAMFQNMVEGRYVDRTLLTKDVPPERHDDLDYLLDMLDWDANVDPDFFAHHHLPPVVEDSGEVADTGFEQRRVVYGAPEYSAKELTVLPGRTAVVRDAAAYGYIVVQGHGSLNGLPIETPVMIRFGEMTGDEGFVSVRAAQAGVTVANHSATQPLVMLKHFGPEM